MTVLKNSSDAVFWYCYELGARIAAKTGNPDNRFHLGHLILQGFKDAPDFILQTDGATDESETFGLALQRSVQCATAFRNIGLKTGDNITLIAPNHIHLTTPFYAALYLGVGISGIDTTLKVVELRDSFKITRPKVVFCQNEKCITVREALNESKLNARIVVFDSNEKDIGYQNFLKTYGSDASVETFKPSEFDPADTSSVLLATSGSTGLPKAADITHKNFAVSLPNFWITYRKFPTPTRLAAVLSPIQWISAIHHFLLCPILRYSRIQSSKPTTTENAYYLINKYKPTYLMASPNMLTSFLNPETRHLCDFTSFEFIMVAGAAVHKGLLEDLKAVSPKAQIYEGYGMSEMSSVTLDFTEEVFGSCGRQLHCYEYRVIASHEDVRIVSMAVSEWNLNVTAGAIWFVGDLVNNETMEDIVEPNVPGELWLRGPSSCKGYYNNKEGTAELIQEDGWVRSGDIFRIDEYGNFFYVDRLKSLLKYRNNHISPIEIENVIKQHPAVLEAAVTGVPHTEHGDLPIAFVVPKTGHEINAQEIKDLVKDTLTDSKQLRGGVIFLIEIPLTSTSKINRKKLAALAREIKKE